MLYYNVHSEAEITVNKELIIAVYFYEEKY